ncbi:acyltransferase [Hypoxylon fragiforme]|uniref:acyltransferase n=1 Tax=Hypoxylon fragiforme TaxID=63214 RepID=UPI0020C5B966|nr:acyltransferase [Hypoxylon fragiforme]KAI2606457.1 acyltransferase [Hypoxylon fragiforme]
MNGFAVSRGSLSYEEKLSLIDDRSLSDVESESARAELDGRFSHIQWAATAKTYCNGFRLSSWSSSLLRIGMFLLPSFIQHRCARERFRTEKLHPTAYLDGMRGLAALFVFFCHYFYTAFKVAEGWGHDNANYEIWRLPFIRLLYSGPSMVCVFFIISGYALSLKPLKQARSRSLDGLSNTMTSFVFRRFFRLYLPPMISTFGVLILLRFGIYEMTRDFVNDRKYVHNVIEHHPVLEETTQKQLRHWVREMYDFVHVWGWEKFGGATGYDVHLWTIPVEFRCSMMLFLVMIGTANLRTGVRFFCLACIMWFVLRSDRWEMVLFLWGMAIAELDLIRGAHEPSPSQQPSPPPATLLPLDSTPSTTPERRSPCNFLWTLLTIPALYLMSEPDAGPAGVPGWDYLGTLIPEWFSDKYRYYQMIGSIIFVFCTARSISWQRAFNSAPVQYFGRISYALYLMHGPVLHTVGFLVEKRVLDWTGTEGNRYTWGFILASVINIPLVIWAADIFWRAVDAPVVRFTKWLEGKLSIQD